MKKEPIDFLHQVVLTEKFARLNLQLSEYSFANLYLFRHIHRYEIIYWDDLLIKGQTRDGQTFFMLTSFPSELNMDKLLPLLSQVDCLFPIPAEWLSFFDSNLFQKSYSDNETDYLFNIDKICHYPGRKLDGKRSFVRHFLSTYSSYSVSLSTQNIEDARNVLKAWQQESGQNAPTDALSCHEALDHFERLGLSGQLIYIDNLPAGFCLGQYLNKDTYAFHFAKARKQFKGIYQYLYQLTAKSIKDPLIHYLNFEQDLGLLNLRQAKQSYHPDSLGYKFRLTALKKSRDH